MKAALLFKSALPAFFTLILSPFCSAQANLAGDWPGSLDIGGNTIHVVWHVVAAPDGALTSTIDNIDMNIYGIKVKSTSVQGSNVTLAVDDQVEASGQSINLVGTFAGTIAANGKEVTGTWTQDEPQQPPTEIHFERAARAAGGAASAAQPSVAGDWAGTLSAGPAQLRLLLHIKAAADGTLNGTLDSIDQGANGIPIKSVTLKDGKLSLDVEAVHGTYEGTVNKDASGISGTWTQGQPLELNFKRAEPQTAAPKAAAPTEIDGTWTGKLETPAATLTINLKIANMDTGLTAELQSPDQSANWAPANSITRDGDKISVRFNAFDATYDGKISADRSTIDGNFTQRGNELPLVLKKI
jgi:hypothetical protein